MRPGSRSDGFVLPDSAAGNRRCFVVAEIGQTHDGSLGQAHAFIDAVAHAGADAVKFQTHIANEESTAAEPWRVPFSKQDRTRYEYWHRMEFTDEQWLGLRRHCDAIGLLFMSSPFSEAAVHLLRNVGVCAWKVASGEVANLQLVELMASSGEPVLVSSGLSTIEEIDAAVKLVRSNGVQVAVLQCATAYPTTPEQIGLNLLAEFRQRWRCPVGLSDHSGTPFPALASVSLGADIVEVHVTLSREMFGPDVPASITTSELAFMIEGIRFIEGSLDHPVDKDLIAGSMTEVREMFTRSIVLRAPVRAGTVLTQAHLASKKPGTGIPPGRIGEVVGRGVRSDLPADHLLKESDLL